MCACVYASACTCACVHACMQVSACVCEHECVHVCVRVCMCVCACAGPSAGVSHVCIFLSGCVPQPLGVWTLGACSERGPGQGLEQPPGQALDPPLHCSNPSVCVRLQADRGRCRLPLWPPRPVGPLLLEPQGRPCSIGRVLPATSGFPRTQQLSTLPPPPPPARVWFSDQPGARPLPLFPTRRVWSVLTRYRPRPTLPSLPSRVHTLV